MMCTGGKVSLYGTCKGAIAMQGIIFIQESHIGGLSIFEHSLNFA